MTDTESDEEIHLYLPPSLFDAASFVYISKYINNPHRVDEKNMLRFRYEFIVDGAYEMLKEANPRTLNENQVQRNCSYCGRQIVYAGNVRKCYTPSCDDKKLALTTSGPRINWTPLFLLYENLRVLGCNGACRALSDEFRGLNLAND